MREKAEPHLSGQGEGAGWQGKAGAGLSCGSQTERSRWGGQRPVSRCRWNPPELDQTSTVQWDWE